MSLNLIKKQIADANYHFPNAELRWAGSDLVVKCPLKTSVGGIYVVKLTLENYPFAMPNVYVTAPGLDSRSPPRYSDNRICYLHPSIWNPGIHNLEFVLLRTAKWLNKYEVWRHKGYWPGAEVPH